MSRADHTSTVPQRRRWGLSGLVSAVFALGLAALLTACGSGQITQTDTQQPAINGANGQIGAIAVRDAQLAYPPNPEGVYTPGATVPLWVSIVNTGVSDDQLVQVTSPAAIEVTIDGSTTTGKAIPGGTTVASGFDVDGVASANSASSQIAPSVNGAPIPVRILLVGIKSINGQPLRAGLTIPVTFVFAHAGQVTLNVPIAVPPNGAQYPSVTTSTTTTTSESSR